MSDSNTTLFRWKINDFYEKRKEAVNSNKAVFSETFALSTAPTTRFALVFKPNVHSTGLGWSQNKYGAMLKEFDNKQQINVDLTFWLEDKNKNRSSEYEAPNQLFEKQGDEFGVQVASGYFDLLYNVYNNHEPLFICCKLVDLNTKLVSALDFNQTSNTKSLSTSDLGQSFEKTTISTSDFDHAFCQNNWALYEEKIYDAIIKIGQKEFKVLKTFFMSQSKVFKQLFLPTFKKGLCLIEISDISEQAMLALIKWLYVGQIEDWSTVEDLFTASEKYEIPVLKKLCVEHLTSTLDNKNFFHRLILAIENNDSKLKEAASERIAKRADWNEFIKSHEWIYFSGKYPTKAKEVSDLIHQKLNV